MIVTKLLCRKRCRRMLALEMSQYEFQEAQHALPLSEEAPQLRVLLRVDGSDLRRSVS